VTKKNRFMILIFRRLTLSAELSQCLTQPWKSSGSTTEFLSNKVNWCIFTAFKNILKLSSIIYKTFAIKAVVVLALAPLGNATQSHHFWWPGQVAVTIVVLTLAAFINVTQWKSLLMLAKAGSSDNGCTYFGSLEQCMQYNESHYLWGLRQVAVTVAVLTLAVLGSATQIE